MLAQSNHYQIYSVYITIHLVNLKFRAVLRKSRPSHRHSPALTREVAIYLSHRRSAIELVSLLELATDYLNETMEQKSEVNIRPEDKKIEKIRSQPRFRVALGLAVALLLVTCAVAAGGLMTYFLGRNGNKRFTIKTSVNGQTFTEEVEVDRENGMVRYRDDVNTGDGEIIQAKEGLTVLYQRGSCHILTDRKDNRTRDLDFDIDAAEVAMKSLADASDVPSFDIDQIVLLNRSVSVSVEDDVIWRSRLPPVCHDVTLYWVQEVDALDYWRHETDSAESTETSHGSRDRRRIGRIEDIETIEPIHPPSIIIPIVSYVERCRRHGTGCVCAFQCLFCGCYKIIIVSW
ncbi:uncharacterized protein LOC144885621 [Branchiostoma floridae x Branchiostoma japonicum]